ncbi:MAG: glycerol-3-phosphate acyltransferase, partial [Clostridia bacterium]|nr:glycerol-3-phosphate acyltransferase [Clostridia bacterium]
NMLRTYGKKAAVLTLIGDMMKTVLSVGMAGIFFGFQYIGGMSVNYVLYVAGLLAAIGHVFPCFYLFKGGKGVLVTATMGLILTPLVFLGLFLVFVLAVALWRYISLGSVTVAVLYPVALDFYFKAVLHAQPSGPILLTSMLLAGLIVWCHRENLKRITNRTENKFSFGKKEPVDNGVKSKSNDDRRSGKKKRTATCPNCGAPYNPNHSKCEYCGTVNSDYYED